MCNLREYTQREEMLGEKRKMRLKWKIGLWIKMSKMCYESKK